MLMCVDHALGHLPHDLGTFGVAYDAPLSAEATTSGSTGVAYSTPLSAVPVLNSNPNATAKLFLDFNGDVTNSWGQFAPGTTPAYDQDGDASTFSDAEINSIREIFARVAEKFAPLNINVTTVDPGTLTDKVAARAVIGGDGAWLGGPSGGVAYVGGFYNSASNTVFVFPENLGNGYAQYVSEAVAHESGHAFGLQHQGSYSGTTLVDEYNPGTSAKAPVMGNSYSATRGLWWYGTSEVSATTFQNDMDVIAGPANGFGYRTDDHGGATSTASSLVLNGTSANGSGIIEKTSDADYFRFDTGAGTVNFTASTIAKGATLDLKLEIRNAAGTVVAVANTSSLGESLSASLAAGTYYLVVSSAGQYGDVGQYTLGGTTVESTGVSAPSSLAANTLSTTSVALNWSDNATNELGYTVQRSTDGGATWTDLTTLGADATSYTDSAGAAGTTYAYRVIAFNATDTSGASNNAMATTITLAPTSLGATAVSSSQINLVWSDVFGETGYTIQRSIDGSNWANVSTVGANVTSYSNTGLAANTQYYYRVLATNAGGASDPSTSAGAKTQAAVVATVPLAPTSLKATATSSSSATLTWLDNSSNETGFRIEYTTDGRNWKFLGNAAANINSITASSLRSKTTYWFRVRAYNTVGNSAWSNTSSTTTPRASASAGKTSSGATMKNGTASIFSVKPLASKPMITDMETLKGKKLKKVLG